MTSTLSLPAAGKKPRLTYLDWARGLAATVMLQGHVFNSFTKNELRESGPYVLSQFVGGVAPALFLFLTGVTFGFLMESREKQGFSLGRRWVAALRRAGYLAMLAALFRLQLWLFAWGQSPWTDLFKVDILNCMGLALLALSPLAMITTLKRARYAAVAGLGIAMLAPVITQLDWSGIHPFVRAYVVPDLNFFGFFPWASFVAFGLSFGSILRSIPQEQTDRVLQWSALVGVGAFLAGYFLSGLPYSIYAKSDFWLDSPGLTVVKLGVILLVVSACFVWTLGQPQGQTSWVVLLGTNSLLVYWVHIELVYGRWLGELKQNLSIPQGALAASVVIVTMIALCKLRRKFKNWSPIPQRTPPLRSAPAAGD